MSLYIYIAKSNYKLNLGVLPKLKAVDMSPNFNYKTCTKSPNFNYKTCTNTELLYALPLTAEFGHNYTHRIARFCCHNNIPIDDF